LVDDAGGGERAGVSACLSLVLPAAPAGVPSARAEITRLCGELGIDGQLADDIRLAVNEACTNCVLHSHGGYAVHPTFVLHARVARDTLNVVVRDFGRGLGYGRSHAGGLGYGLQLIGQLADTARVTSPPGGGVRVAMRFEMRSRQPALLRRAA
jgi:anti-sigma regulatory factor (Ser/Thr protein kinase)